MRIGNTMTESLSVRSAQGFDRQLSKVVENGNTYRAWARVVYGSDNKPTFVWPSDGGRALSLDVFNSTWISYPEGGLERLSNGHYSDVTVLSTWARIARILHNAAYRFACKKAKSTAELEADGGKIDEVALEKALTEIDAEYNGAKVAGTNIPPKIQPVIGPIKIAVTAQIAIVKYDEANKKVDWDSLATATVAISNTKANELKSGLNPANGFDPDFGLVEYRYEYSGADKKTAGMKAKFEPIKTKDNRLESLDPEGWAANKDTIFSRLSDNPDVVIAKSQTLSSTITIEEVVSKMKSYCAKAKGVIKSIDTEDKDVAKFASFMLENGVVNSSLEMKEELEALAAKVREEEGADAAEEESTLSDAEQQAAELNQALKESTESLEDVFNKAGEGVLDDGEEIVGSSAIEELE